MDVERIVMGITLTLSPFVCVLLACAGIHGSVGMDDIWMGVGTVLMYWGFLAVATILLRLTDVKEGVKDARLSK